MLPPARQGFTRRGYNRKLLMRMDNELDKVLFCFTLFFTLLFVLLTTATCACARTTSWTRCCVHALTQSLYSLARERVLASACLCSFAQFSFCIPQHAGAAGAGADEEGQGHARHHARGGGTSSHSKLSHLQACTHSRVQAFVFTRASIRSHFPTIARAHICAHNRPKRYSHPKCYSHPKLSTPQMLCSPAGGHGHREQQRRQRVYGLFRGGHGF
jgi:hypothetical protein